MTTSTVLHLGLVSGQEAGPLLGIDPATIRSWVKRGHVTAVLKTRDGSRVTSWYRTDDLWRCARARLSKKQLDEIRDTWAEVDRLLAEAAGEVPL